MIQRSSCAVSIFLKALEERIKNEKAFIEKLEKLNKFYDQCQDLGILTADYVQNKFSDVSRIISITQKINQQIEKVYGNLQRESIDETSAKVKIVLIIEENFNELTSASIDTIKDIEIQKMGKKFEFLQRNNKKFQEAVAQFCDQLKIILNQLFGLVWQQFFYLGDNLKNFMIKTSIEVEEGKNQNTISNESNEQIKSMFEEHQRNLKLVDDSISAAENQIFMEFFEENFDMYESRLDEKRNYKKNFPQIEVFFQENYQAAEVILFNDSIFAVQIQHPKLSLEGFQLIEVIQFLTDIEMESLTVNILESIYFSQNTELWDEIPSRQNTSSLKGKLINFVQSVPEIISNRISVINEDNNQIEIRDSESGKDLFIKCGSNKDKKNFLEIVNGVVIAFAEQIGALSSPENKQQKNSFYSGKIIPQKQACTSKFKKIVTKETTANSLAFSYYSSNSVVRTLNFNFQLTLIGIQNRSKEYLLKSDREIYIFQLKRVNSRYQQNLYIDSSIIKAITGPMEKFKDQIDSSTIKDLQSQSSTMMNFIQNKKSDAFAIDLHKLLDVLLNKNEIQSCFIFYRKLLSLLRIPHYLTQEDQLVNQIFEDQFAYEKKQSQENIKKYEKLKFLLGHQIDNYKQFLLELFIGKSQLKKTQSVSAVEQEEPNNSTMEIQKSSTFDESEIEEKQNNRLKVFQSMELSENFLAHRSWSKIYTGYREDQKAKQVSNNNVIQFRLEVALPNERTLLLDVDENWRVSEVLNRIQKELEFQFFSDFGLFERITERIDQEMPLKTYFSSFQWLPNDSLVFDQFVSDFDQREKHSQMEFYKMVQIFDRPTRKDYSKAFIKKVYLRQFYWLTPGIEIELIFMDLNRLEFIAHLLMTDLEHEKFKQFFGANLVENYVQIAAYYMIAFKKSSIMDDVIISNFETFIQILEDHVYQKIFRQKVRENIQNLVPKSQFFKQIKQKYEEIKRFHENKLSQIGEELCLDLESHCQTLLVMFLLSQPCYSYQVFFFLTEKDQPIRDGNTDIYSVFLILTQSSMIICNCFDIQKTIHSFSFEQWNFDITQSNMVIKFMITQKVESQPKTFSFFFSENSYWFQIKTYIISKQKIIYENILNNHFDNEIDQFYNNKLSYTQQQKKLAQSNQQSQYQ